MIGCLSGERMDSNWNKNRYNYVSIKKQGKEVLELAISSLQ